MSVANEISRIFAGRDKIRTKLVNLGLATSTDNLDVLADVIDAMDDNGAVSQSLHTTAVSYTIPEGYHNGSGTVSITLEEKSATPAKTEQTVTPSAGKVLSKVTVGAIPDAYQDVTGVTTTAANVLTGTNYVAADGTVTAGTMPNNGAVSATITGLTAATSSYTIPEGYHNGSGTVSLTADIETKLAAI